jgi:uncharacterized 2Fe-2S/4Fe-4S cluster protein (DUF4445 family)
MPRITLQPLGVHFDVPAGTPLNTVLFEHGVEFPCGGKGVCGRCRARVLQGALPVTEHDRQAFNAAQLADGWRLTCRALAAGDLTIEVAQWNPAILADDRAVQVTPREGLGIAVDVGTTTLVAQLVDRVSGKVLAVQSSLNPQGRHGADVMSRVQFAVTGSGREVMRELIRAEVGRLAETVARSAPAGETVRLVTVVGNTAMHHLFCDLDCTPLTRYPFDPVEDGLQRFAAADLGWAFADAEVRFLPCLGGFVGSDILGGIIATRLNESADLVALVDLGTNGEIVVGSRVGLMCASTAAGPAFEGARISIGMRAATGAISGVSLFQGEMRIAVIGGGEPRGICGSGLVDAVACGLDQGRILPSGRLAGGAKTLPLVPGLELTQADIRQLQLAKGATAAGIKILLERLGAKAADVKRLYLAGAFGNYIVRANAQRIGLLDFTEGQVSASGNTALLGARLALFRPDDDFGDLRRFTRHIPLNADPRFEDIYVESMGFPDSPTA